VFRDSLSMDAESFSGFGEVAVTLRDYFKNLALSIGQVFRFCCRASPFDCPPN
jgi:hypothetical protein